MYIKKLNNEGMTLVDTIIGVCLLSLCAIMMAVGFTTCANLINEANRFKTQSARVSTNVEVGSFQGDKLDKDIAKAESSVIVDKTNNVSVDGIFYQCNDPKTGVTYTMFVPNTIEDLEQKET